jgi:hypothetical protein
LDCINKESLALFNGIPYLYMQSVLPLASYGITAVMKTSILLANILALLPGPVNAQSSTLTTSSRSAAARATAAATPIINVNSTVTGALNATAWALIVSSTKFLISRVF